MNDEQIKRIVEDMYDDSGEDTYWSMVKDFYNKKMFTVVIALWVFALIFLSGAVVSAVFFFMANITQYHIMYSTLFITFMLFFSMIKIFAWQMIHRNNIKREIKRLELRIAELSQAFKDNK